MKRKGYLYQDIIDKSNIRKAIIKSSKGKTKRRDVCKILDNLEYYVEEIHRDDKIFVKKVSDEETIKKLLTIVTKEYLDAVESLEEK